jgi:hypothetical protein
MVNYMNQVNLAGIDEIVANSRVRAFPSTTNSQGTMWMQGTGVPTSIASGVGATTLTAAVLGGGIVVHNLGANTNVSDPTDTATNILAYMNANSAGVNVGDIFGPFMITNSGSGTSVLTITGGTGVTFDANNLNTISAGISKQIMFRCTSTTTPTFIAYM